MQNAALVSEMHRACQQFDQFRRWVDNAELGGLDGIYRRAFEVLSSDKVAQALDLSREDPRLRDRYGIGSPEPVDDAAPRWNDQFLIARRLIEAGARCVTIAFGSWDTHGGNFARLRTHYDEGEIVEISAMAGLFNYFNRVNDALQMEPTKPGEGL